MDTQEPKPTSAPKDPAVIGDRAAAKKEIFRDGEEVKEDARNLDALRHPALRGSSAPRNSREEDYLMGKRNLGPEDAPKNKRSYNPQQKVLLERLEGQKPDDAGFYKELLKGEGKAFGKGPEETDVEKRKTTYGEPQLDLTEEEYEDILQRYQRAGLFDGDGTEEGGDKTEGENHIEK